MSIIAYTDGSYCISKKRGGWGAVVFIDDEVKEMRGESTDSTNNVMEMTAVMNVLKTYKTFSTFTFYTDSRYVIGCATNEYKIKENREMWKKYKKLAKDKTINFVWIKGHNKNEWNERADYLAGLYNTKL